MPEPKKKSSLFAKYGDKLNKSVQAHADDETKYGLVRLPPGITGGIAQLTECGFFECDKDTKMKKADGKSAVGEFYMRCVGVVVEPEFVEHKGQRIRVRGLQTSIMEPVFDTKTSKGVVSQDDHIQNILNEFRKLGGEDYTAGATGADLENLATGLKESAPYFNFDTNESEAVLKDDGSIKYPARTWERWNGARNIPPDYTPPEDGQVQDDTGGGNDDSAAQAAAEGDDLDALLTAAQDDTDEEAQAAAQTRLRELAIENGCTEEQVDADDTTWEMVRDWAENGPPADDAAAEPEKGGTCNYGIYDGKTKKTKQTKCEITQVNAGKRTVQLKNLTTGKIVVGKDNKPMQVSWDDIELG